MKKRNLFFALMLSVASTVFAEEVQIDGLWYNLSGTTAEVIQYKEDVKYAGDIVIPSTVSYNNTDYSVTSIGDNAFSDSWGLESITIPNSVTTIGNRSFYYCPYLTSITIPNSVTSIGNQTFMFCMSLNSITIPNSVTTIGHGTFQYGGLTTITIPKSVTNIGYYVFQGCGGLTSIVVEEGNTKYDSRNNCNAIIETSSNTLIAGCQNTTIPSSVTSIGATAFCECRYLSSVTIPNSVTSIGLSAFSGCSSLTSIEIPNGVTTIGNNAFNGCGGLTSIVVEEGNTKYDSRNNCNAIIETSSNTLIAGCQNTTIPSSVTSIGYYAFGGCASLTSIMIPNNVTSILTGAFSGCSSLTSITIPNSITSIEDATFANCGNLTSITISNNVTSIGTSAFYGCSGLSSITIPNSVTTIGFSAFYGCSGLKDFYCYAETVPTTNLDVFSNTLIGDITLHILPSSIDAYKTTTPWSDFKEIVESDYLDVADLNTIDGESNTQEISLSNGLSNLVGFQMDLTLPEGVSIDKTGCSLSSRITDESQELTIGKLESGAYRITSTSLSLTPISGNDGTLLSLILTGAEGSNGGQATISNIIFSTSESEKIIMSDKTFDITILKKYNLTYNVDGEVYKTEVVAETIPLTPETEPTKDGYTFGGWSEIPETMPNHDLEITGRFYLYGDVNTDEAVDVVDVVDIARFVVATPSANFREKLADLNFDNTVNIADAVTLVNQIAGDQNLVKAMGAKESYNYDLCQLQLLSANDNALSLSLDGDADFTAFQFEVELPLDVDISAMRLNGKRNDGHQLLFNKVADNRYRVTALSLTNAAFKGSDGELLNISINGLPAEEISIQNVLFVTQNGIGVTFDGISLGEPVTGIANVNVNEDNDIIYDLQGRRLSEPQRGVNIVNGKKVYYNKY